MDLNTSSIDDGAAASKEEIISATREVKKAHVRNRKKRTKVFSHAVDYLDMIIPAVYEQHKNYLMGSLVESMDEIRELLLEVLKLLLPLLEQGRIDGIQYDATNYATILESFVVHLKQWCTTQEPTTGLKPLLYFLDLTYELLTGIIELIADSDSWRYVEFINTPITFVILQWDEAGAAATDKLLQWTKSTAYSMNSLEKRISQCGDFDCQYFLVILIQHWLTWAGMQTADNYLEAAFPLVSLDLRRRLLEVQDFDYGGRTFLNALNSNSSGGPRAKGIFSIRCLYFFAGEEQLKPPEDNDQLWVDFSAVSRRVHSFISIPGNAWIDLNIGSENIDSICVSWLRRGDDFSKSQMMSESCNNQGLTQEDFTQFSIVESSRLMFLHIQLTENFSEMNQDLHEFHDKDVRSLTLVFQDLSLVEQVLHQMTFPTHSNGEQCVRPQALVDIIQGQSPPLPEPGMREVNDVHIEEVNPISDTDLVLDTFHRTPARARTPANPTRSRSRTPARHREAVSVSKGTPYPVAEAATTKSLETSAMGTSIEDMNEFRKSSVENRRATPGRLRREASMQPPPRQATIETPSFREVLQVSKGTPYPVSEAAATTSLKISEMSPSMKEMNEFPNSSVENRMATPGNPRQSREASIYPSSGQVTKTPLSNKENSARNSNHSHRLDSVEMLQTPGHFYVAESSSEEHGPNEDGYDAPGSEDMFSSDEEEWAKCKSKKFSSAGRSLNVTVESMFEDPIPRSVREKISSRESSDTISPKSASLFPRRSQPPVDDENVKERGRLIRNSDISLFQSFEKSHQSPYPIQLKQQDKRPTPAKEMGEMNDKNAVEKEFVVNSELSLFLSDEEEVQPQSKERKKKVATKKQKQSKVVLPKSKPITKTSTAPSKNSAVRGRARTSRLVQNTLSISVVEHNPVPKVSGRSPCYRNSMSTSKAAASASPSPPPLTQFKDPYDITADEDFLKEKLTKTYSRRNRKRKPVARSTRNADVNIFNKTASDEELEQLVKNLPVSPVVPAKAKRGRPKKQQQETVPKKPRQPPKKKEKLDDNNEQEETVPKKPASKPRQPPKKKKKLDNNNQQEETVSKKPASKPLQFPNNKEKVDDNNQQEIFTPDSPVFQQTNMRHQGKKAIPLILESEDSDSTQARNEKPPPKFKPFSYSSPSWSPQTADVLDLSDTDCDANQSKNVPQIRRKKPSLADQTFDWGNIELDLGDLELDKDIGQSSYGLFEQGTPTPLKGGRSRGSSVCSRKSRRSAASSRPATPKPTIQKQLSSDDSFDWDNIHLE